MKCLEICYIFGGNFIFYPNQLQNRCAMSEHALIVIELFRDQFIEIFFFFSEQERMLIK